MLAAATEASVVLTRPHGKNEALATRLAQAGLNALILPALHIEPLDRQAPLPLPEHYDLIVFVSGNAARFYMDRLAALRPAASWPAATRAATVGAPSARYLQDYSGIPASQILHPGAQCATQDSEGLWAVLQPMLADLKRVLIVRGQAGREWLGERFQQAGIQVDRLPLYNRRAAIWDRRQGGALAAALHAPGPCVFLLTSGEGVDAVQANILRLGLQEAWKRSRFVAIHERVASRLQSALAASGKVESPMVKLCQPDDDAIFQALVRTASL
ncbi:uroporphyrinogen-III synthase [Pollutimonas sp. M17]|uniref:uroporphyrinogen-III synthase n=1 Tax=Pollutimonas sp. M17 TaxID=2962065 RepID=UPI0021F473CC|nr:uroporphyrinogen-III synthase [Pollutimonas sp. M17]UYO92316.1 uroporphyrinogen-III synthase [Pollutimonas sp. M17]